jgi:ABC-type multidrug transport system permease subunit
LIRNLADSIVATQSAFFAFYDFLLPLYDDGAAMTKAVDAAFTTLFFRLIGRKSMLDIAEGQALSTTRFVVSALLCLLAMITALPILLLIQQDRRSGLQDRLVAAHVGWHHFFLARQLTGLIWLAASFVPILTALFHLYPDMDRLAAIIAILTLYWSAATLAQAVGLIFTPGEPVVLAAWLGILALLLLGGCIYPRQLLPDILRQIGRAVPPAWAQQQLYRALAGQTSSLPDLVLPTLPALAAAVAVYWGWRRCRQSSEV